MKIGVHTNCVGMTMMELLAVLVIVMLGSAMSVPTVSGLRQRLQADNHMAQAMQLALLSRQRAALSRQAVVWCPDDGQARCASSWAEASAWLVFSDQERNRQRDADDVILVRQALPEGDGHLVWRGFAKGSALMWLPNGLAAYQNGTLTYCPDAYKPALVRQLVLNRIGRPRYQALPAARQQTLWREICAEE